MWATFAHAAGIEWFLASRPRLFVRLLVRRGERRAAYRAMLRNPDRRRAHRRAAVVQFAVGTLAAVAALLVAWLG